MRNWLFAARALFAGSAWGTVYLTEAWDTGTPPSGWPCQNAPSTCPSQTYNGWVNELASYCTGFPSWATTGVSTTRAHSGTKSFYTFRAAGVSESCDIRRYLSSAASKIYIRFWLWLNGDFINFNTPVTREPSYHFMFTNSAQALTGLRVNILVKVPWTGSWQCGAGRGGIPADQPFAFFSIQDYSHEFTTGTYASPCFNLLAHLNEWMAVEFMFDAPNNRATIWINGTQVYDATEQITDSTFDNIFIANYMSLEDGTGFDTSYYIDDLIVSDTYNGPGSLLPGPRNVRWRPRPRKRRKRLAGADHGL